MLYGTSKVEQDGVNPGAVASPPLCCVVLSSSLFPQLWPPGFSKCDQSAVCVWWMGSLWPRGCLTGDQEVEGSVTQDLLASHAHALVRTEIDIHIFLSFKDQSSWLWQLCSWLTYVHAMTHVLFEQLFSNQSGSLFSKLCLLCLSLDAVIFYVSLCFWSFSANLWRHKSFRLLSLFLNGHNRKWIPLSFVCDAGWQPT